MDYTKAKNKEIIADLCDRIKLISGQLCAMGKTAPNLADELDEYFKDLQEVESTLEVFILPYFQNLGTQKSRAKATASRANGLKGGRPPKRITELKRQIADIESNLDEKGKSNDLQRLKDELERLEQERQTKTGGK